MKKNLILCGFMGCGKTTVGKLLSKEKGMPFADMDKEIERRYGESVAEMFARYGEEGFREREHAVCRTLSEKSGCVIAAGGGAVTFPRNVEVLRKNGVILFLHVGFHKATERLAHDTSRPLLNRSDKVEAAWDLYEKRIPLYRAVSDGEIPADGPPMEVVKHILHWWENGGEILLNV